MKLAANIVLIRLCVIRSDDPRKYPNDINPKNMPIIILVITALEPTQNDNWRSTTNSKDKLTYPFRKIKNINHMRNLRDMKNPPDLIMLTMAYYCKNCIGFKWEFMLSRVQKSHIVKF